MPQLLEAASSRFKVEQSLRRAVERGEFELLYQPEVCFETMETHIVEALLRWRQPDGNVVAPADFFEVAEQTGLISDISDWALRSAIEAAAFWQSGPWPRAKVAVNISSQQFLDGQFRRAPGRLLKRHGLPAECLEIELTENVLQTGPTTIAALHRLRELGVSIALDDFGTGYSSLTSLERLPLTRVKIDRGLIGSIDTSARSPAIVRSIVGLCHSLGLQVTAEGVERAAQLGPLLMDRGVQVQGYLVSRPLKAATVPVFLTESRRHLEQLMRQYAHAGGRSRRQRDPPAYAAHARSAPDSPATNHAFRRRLEQKRRSLDRQRRGTHAGSAEFLPHSFTRPPGAGPGSVTPSQPRVRVNGAWVALLTLVLVVAVLWAAKAILLPLALGIILAFALTPVVRTFDRTRLPRFASVALTMLLALGIVGGIGYVVFDQFTELSTQLTHYTSSMRRKVAELRPANDAAFRQLTRTMDRVTEQLDDSVVDVRRAQPVRVVEPRSSVARLRETAGSVFEPIASTIIVLVLVAFMLGSARGSARPLYPSARFRERELDYAADG